MDSLLVEVRNALIAQGGVVLCFIVALRTGHKQVWRWDREVKVEAQKYVEMKADRDFWRDHALESYQDARLIREHAMRVKDRRDGGATA